MNTEDQNTTPVESGNHDTTPESSGNALTTPPEAEKTGTTQEPAEHDIERIVKKRLDRERKKWEAEAEEAAKRARMDEAERLKAELADKDKEIAQRDAALAREKAIRALTGKVADPEAAYKLAEGNDDLMSDGSVDAEALLKAYPFLAPQQDTKRVDLPGQRTTTGATSELKPEDFRGKSQEWITANLHRLKK